MTTIARLSLLAPLYYDTLRQGKCITAVYLTLRLPNQIPFVIGVILVAGKVFTHTCDAGNVSALIQC
jgi:hypothetical protein